MIVSDTGPLIAFARLGRLDLLRQVAGELIIPQAVFDEMTVRHDRPGAAEVQDSNWMHTQAVGDQAAVSALSYAQQRDRAPWCRPPALPQCSAVAPLQRSRASCLSPCNSLPVSNHQVPDQKVSGLGTTL